MISVGEARALVMSTVKRTAVEELVLMKALGRYLAHGITSPMELPGFDNSAMDGYALRFGDAEKTSTDNPLTLRLVGVIPAGESPSQELQQGQTMQIFTEVGS